MKKFLKVVLMVMVFTLMFAVNVFASDDVENNDSEQNVQNSVASSRIARYYSESIDYDFDDAHSIHIVVNMWIDYSWIDGEYGWINDAHTVDEEDDYPMSSVSSNDISIIDDLLLEESICKTESSYYERWYFYGTKVHGYNFYEYLGHILITVYVDEWGELEIGVQFVECTRHNDDSHDGL